MTTSKEGHDDYDINIVGSGELGGIFSYSIIESGNDVYFQVIESNLDNYFHIISLIIIF